MRYTKFLNVQYCIEYICTVYTKLLKFPLPTFRGVATIDIELTSIDINQCDLTNTPKQRATFDVFRGTHLCQPSTEVSMICSIALKI